MDIILSTAAALCIAVVLFQVAVARHQKRPVANPSQPYAKVIADSVTKAGYRLTTMEVRFHRFVLAEFNTHSMFVRNSASSRAIPTKKMVEMVRNDPAMPLRWPSEQSGMQGGDSLTEKQIERAQARWLACARIAADFASVLNKMGVHKSITNRLLEPFMWHTVVVTSAFWENFFAQRVSPLAQREIAVPAEMMQRALHASTPVELEEGEVHAPYMDEATREEITNAYSGFDDKGTTQQIIARVSSARCARTSYLTQDGVRDFRSDLRLYFRLKEAKPEPHWSPLAHVAIPCEDNVQSEPLEVVGIDGTPLVLETDHLAKVGQFPGWITLRHMTESEMGVITAR